MNRKICKSNDKGILTFTFGKPLLLFQALCVAERMLEQISFVKGKSYEVLYLLLLYYENI